MGASCRRSAARLFTMMVWMMTTCRQAGAFAPSHLRGPCIPPGVQRSETADRAPVPAQARCDHSHALERLQQSRRSVSSIFLILPSVALLPGRASARGGAGHGLHTPHPPKMPKGSSSSEGARAALHELPGTRSIASTGFRSAGYGDRPGSPGGDGSNPWKSKEKDSCPIKGACAPKPDVPSADATSARFLGATPRRPL